MRIINNLNDLSALKAQISLHLRGLVQEAEHDFCRYHQSLNPFESIEDFSLEEYGPIVVLEPGDDLHNLHELGFSPAHDGLFGSNPEFATKIESFDQVFYKIFIMSDNEYITTIYVPKDLDPYLEEWVECYLDTPTDNKIDPNTTKFVPF